MYGVIFYCSTVACSASMILWYFTISQHTKKFKASFVDCEILNEKPVDLTGKVVCWLYDIPQILDDAHKVIHTVGAIRLLDKRHNAHQRKRLTLSAQILRDAMLAPYYKVFFFLQNFLLENCHLEGYF